jgi:hypothetical protein
VWARAYGYDPQLPLRGRYLSLQVAVDGCQSTLPSSRQALFPRDVAGAVKPGPYSVKSASATQYFTARLLVQNNTLQAVYIQNENQRQLGQVIYAQPGKPCNEMRLSDPVDYFIADNAPSLLPLKPGQELWLELTIPPVGPPRPIQLALKNGTEWTPISVH